MKLVILTTLFAGAFAVPMFQAMDVKDDGSYRFSFETGKDGGSHSRTEHRDEDGVVIGKYSYEDPNGAIREVNYRADSFGYVANGDVGVEGAPKGQFPAPPPESDLSLNVPAEEQNAEESEVHKADHEDTEAAHSNEEAKDEDIPDLPLEDSTVNDPPEAFPEGYFLNKFHSLRRLPEPTKEEPSSTSEPSTEAKIPDSSEDPNRDDSPTASPVTELANIVPNEELNKINRAPTSEMELFMHLRPFQNFPSPQFASSMFHQPVYVFSYQQPESYGYHYFY